VKWATRPGVHVDRTGCAWLIRRFIDPEAEFTFITDVSEMPADTTAFIVLPMRALTPSAVRQWIPPHTRESMTSWGDATRRTGHATAATAGAKRLGGGSSASTLRGDESSV
jgi:Chromate resistance exported protein